MGWLRPQYDQTTYWGRFRYFLRIFDVRQLIRGESRLVQAQQLLTRYRKGLVPYTPENERKLHEAIVTRDAARHPVTGQAVFLPVRRTMFIPMNLPIAAGIILSPQTVGWVFFWQWVNQSLNAGINLGNDSGGGAMPLSQVAGCYGAACGASLAVVLGAGRLLNVWKRTPLSRGVLGSAVTRIFMPLASMQVAAVVSLYLSRKRELTEGVPVFNERGEQVAKSTAAAADALFRSAVTRFVLPTTTVLPPIVVYSLAVKYYPWLKDSLRATAAVKLACLLMVLTVSLPLSTAVFPVVRGVPTSTLEPAAQQQVAASVRRLGYTPESVATGTQADPTVYYYRGV